MTSYRDDQDHSADADHHARIKATVDLLHTVLSMDPAPDSDGFIAILRAFSEMDVLDPRDALVVPAYVGNMDQLWAGKQQELTALGFQYEDAERLIRFTRWAAR